MNKAVASIPAEYLVVPVNIEAMCLGKESNSDNSFTTDPYQFNLLSHSDIIPLSKQIKSIITTSMEKGIYLHWALPDGLTHAVENRSDKEGGNDRMVFPVVPNRWLVTRLTNGKDLKHWVVESDYLSETNDERAGQPIPKMPKQTDTDVIENRNEAFGYLGRVLSLEEWQKKKNTDPGKAYKNLTAVGYGIPEFAASYQHSKGIFSFYDDDLEDFAGDVSISYFVTGWYETYHSSHPILKGSPEIEKLLETYRWCLPEGTKTKEEDGKKIAGVEETDKKLDQTYFSGSISGIVWNRDKQYLNDLNYPEINIAIGHNENEALSALMSGGSPQNEQLLNALQLEILEDVIQPGSINALQNVDRKINDATFQSKDGGTYWQIEPGNTENAWKTENKPVGLSGKLNNLNTIQKEADEWERLVASRRKQLYLYWTASLTPNTDYQPELRFYLSEQIQDLKDNEKVLTAKKDKLSKAKNELKNQLESSDFELVEYRSARYYLPSEPVILFQGTKINAPARYGGDGDHKPENTLLCRLGSQLIRNFENIKVTDPIFPDTFTDVPAEVIHDLLLNNPDYLHARDGLDQVERQEDESNRSIASGDNKNTDGKNISPSPVGVNHWDHNPWLPLYFKYDVTYYPADSKVEGQFISRCITDHFNLDHESDKLTAKNYQVFSERGIQYQNTCLLSRHSKVNLQEKIKSYIKKYPEQEDLDAVLTTLLEAGDQLPDLLSQSLFGLNEALIGLKNTLQLPVVNYDKNATLQKLSVAIHDCTEQSNTCELDNSDGTIHYHPLSAGLLKINSLVIVDAFGRNIEVPKNRLYRANSLMVSDQSITNVYLAPRLAVPCRLNVSWLDQNSIPLNGLPENSPISGWLIPNFIDESIWLFTSDGEAAGELTADGWQKTPGCTFENMEDAVVGNGVFKNVVLYLENNVNHFLARVRETFDTNQPENYRSLNTNTLFSGVPLAIARLTVLLEVEGLPPVDFSDRSIEDEVNEEKTNSVFDAENRFRRSRDLDKVNFPLLVGNNNHAGDGLMAYTESYTTFYYDNEEQTINLGSKALELCAVFDPRNAIHLHTGILPVKELRMPEYCYVDTLRKMQFAIEVHGLITASPESGKPVKMPLPNTGGNGTWEWWFENSRKQWESVPAQEEHDHAVNEGFNERTQGWLKLTTHK